MDILLCFNRKYRQHAATTMISAIENNHKQINFHVLHKDLLLKDENIFKKFIHDYDCNIYFYKIDPNDYKGFPVEDDEPVTVETYFRILGAKYIPRHVHRILYIDTDTLVLDDISNLFSLESGGAPLAAVLGCAPAERKLALGMKADSQYFNAGVLLLNLDYWRDNRLTEKLTEFIHNSDPKILERWDQDALNALLFEKSWIRLPLKY
ncbi:MAG: glycosyltransferase family 8 protein [Lachnospiraceae bacterium]|nr:glycosyltransferase family 8 protein [Lachnospiraceae bacterium]